METQLDLNIFRLQACAWLSVFAASLSHAPAQSRDQFCYKDSGGGTGCFAFVSRKDWIECTSRGEILALKETARTSDFIELADPGHGGVRVRILSNAWQSGSVSRSEESWETRGSGSWERTADLRAEFQEYSLTPRLQGSRPTCSVFTTVGALEFGITRKLGKPTPLSVEFLNWASNQAAGDDLDGSFFASCLDGVRKYGICDDPTMPYLAHFDPKSKPASPALEMAETLRREIVNQLLVHWILPPGNQEPGLSDRQFAEVRATLARGYPVAFGSGHSILLIGFHDDAKKPGGGEFFVRDSNQPQFAAVSYEHVRTKPYDVFWVEFAGAPRTDRRTWAYKTGVFKRNGDSLWTEVCDDGSTYSFQETMRATDLVELVSAERQLTLRIYGSAQGKMFYKKPEMRAWALMYDGKWTE